MKVFNKIVDLQNELFNVSQGGKGNRLSANYGCAS